MGNLILRVDFTVKNVSRKKQFRYAICCILELIRERNAINANPYSDGASKAALCLLAFGGGRCSFINRTTLNL